MAGRSRQIQNIVALGKNDKIPPELGFCRKCQTIKDAKEFYVATDNLLDLSGRMSVCKSCISDLVIKFINSERDIKKAIFLVCKSLNVAYNESSIDSAVNQLSAKLEGSAQVDFSKLFGIYKTKLVGLSAISGGDVGTFEYSFGMVFNREDEKSIIDNEGEDFSEYLKKTWGNGLSYDDYQFLEETLANWKSSHKCDTNSELVLLKLICHAELDIRRAREVGGDTKSLVKALQDLIKTSNLSPAQSAMSILGGKGQQSLGVALKEIEETTPLVWLESHKNPFEDVDNLGQYWLDFITRPIKNIITGSRDFTVKSMDEDGKMEIDIKESDEEIEI